MYLDPGFGGMLLQVIIAIVAVGGGILFSFRKKIKNLFSKNKNNTKTQANNNNINASIQSIEDAIDMIDDEQK